MWRTDSLEKTPMLEKIEDRWRGRRRIRWVDGITDSMHMSFWPSSSSWQWTGRPGVLQSMGSQRVGHDWATKLNWNTLSSIKYIHTVVQPSPHPSPELFLFCVKLKSCIHYPVILFSPFPPGPGNHFVSMTLTTLKYLLWVIAYNISPFVCGWFN